MCHPVGINTNFDLLRQLTEKMQKHCRLLNEKEIHKEKVGACIH